MKLNIPKKLLPRISVVFMLALATFSSTRVLAADSQESAFLAENEVAMNKMMDDMTVKPSGEVDKDFVAMMVPHHQGAIEMAQAELRYGHNEQLRRIAQEIIVEQQQEIIAMRLALGQSLPPPAAAPDQPVTTPPANLSPATVPPHTMHMTNKAY